MNERHDSTRICDYPAETLPYDSKRDELFASRKSRFGAKNFFGGASSKRENQVSALSSGSPATKRTGYHRCSRDTGRKDTVKFIGQRNTNERRRDGAATLLLYTEIILSTGDSSSGNNTLTHYIAPLISSPPKM